MIEQICKKLGITVDELRHPNRLRTITAKRHVACWALRHQAHMSYPEIGDLLHRSHPTIMHACARVDACLAVGDPLVTNLIDRLE